LATAHAQMCGVGDCRQLPYLIEAACNFKDGGA
jgi:hypothetical protein